MEKIIFKRFLLAKDDFYDDPHHVTNVASNASYFQPDHCTGYRSSSVYHETGVRRKLERILGVKILRWDTSPTDENGIFYFGFSKGVKKEVPGVHADWPYNDITCLIYLTPDLPFEYGTSLWMHKRTGLTKPPSIADAKRLKIKISELRNLLDYDTKDRSKWIEIDRIGNKYNRMVAYPSGVFHSATKHFGDNLENGRIYQTFRIGVDWDTFKMK